MAVSFFLKSQLQILGIFHYAPIHRRLKCLLCQNRKEESRIDRQSSQHHLDEFRFRSDESRVQSPDEHNFSFGGNEFMFEFDDENHNSNDGEDEALSRGGWRGEESSEGVYALDAPCTTCNSLLWNKEGQLIQDIEELVPTPISRAIGTVASMIFMVLLVTGIFYTSAIYVGTLFGRDDEIMHLTSFMTLSMGVASVALICLMAKVTYYLMGYGNELDAQKHRMHWCAVLHQDFMARRLQYLFGSDGFRLPSKIFAVTCIGWPALNVVLEVVYYDILQCNGHDNLPFALPQILCQMMALFLFGIFCHTLFLIRCSFEYECNLLLGFLSENEGHLDRCRMRIAETYRDFREFRSSLHPWISFVIAMSVLGLTVHLSWNYSVYSGNAEVSMTTEELIIINIIIFSEKFMLLALTLWAAGGMDLDFIWRCFHFSLSRHRRHAREHFWERLIYYLRDLDDRDGSTSITMFLSVVSLYTGLRLSAQNLNYSGGPSG